jgi:hypothetical protein
MVMKRFTCDWIFNTLVVLCDGTVVCGCADPYGQRPLGNIHTQSLHEIWNAPETQSVRRDLNNGYASFCEPCGLKRCLDDDEQPEQRPIQLDTILRLFVEPTVLCNLDCYKSVCNSQSGIVGTRDHSMMSFDCFKRISDETGSGLVRLDFFNYGESFVNPQAVEMLEYFKSRYPDVYVYLSTNGLMLDDDKIHRLVKAGIDEITFSVDGADQETYSRYRVKGDFETVKRNMELCVKTRNKFGREIPFINWRYILFSWNDSDAHMQKARECAESLGIDRLTWEITDHPPDAVSARFQIGTDDWKRYRHEIWDTSNLGNAIHSKQALAEIRPSRKLPLITRRSRPAQLTVTVTNKTAMPWWHRTDSGRRTVRLGAQLLDHKNRLLNRDYCRAFLPRTLRLDESATLKLDLPPIPKAGLYRLKLDMVSEGIDWFERTGSPIARITMVVV